jgi:polar amino acid transport system substrate-binding protein
MMTCALQRAWEVHVSRCTSILRTITLACLASAATVIPVQAGDALAKIADRSKLAVCTNVNNPPLAYLEPSGKARGMHMALLEDLRLRLSKKLAKDIQTELVPTLPANRVQFLQQGKCDMIFTSLTVTPEREKLVQFIEPYYYAAGAALFTRKGMKIAKWEDLKGKPICSNQGSSWNLPLEQKFGANIVAFQSQQEVDQSLRDGRCIALVSDDSYLQSRLITDKEGHWKDYMIQELVPFSEGPWGLAVQFGDPQFKTYLSDVVTDWHASGLVIEEARKVGLKPSPLAQNLHDKFKKP